MSLARRPGMYFRYRDSEGKVVRLNDVTWLAKAVRSKTKEAVSLAAYTAAMPLAFVNEWISHALYVSVALMWLVPDPRIETRLKE